MTQPLPRPLRIFTRLAPFAAIFLAYESFRALVPRLHGGIEYQWMITVDKLLGRGMLPTVRLQEWLWQGQVQWFDFVFYAAYLLHFILPVGLALVIWKYRDKFYWEYITSFVALSLAGFMTYVLFPAAPPWLAYEQGFIPHIVRVSGHVWSALGIGGLGAPHTLLSSNPAAAVPSLHASYATLFVLCVYQLFGIKKATLASIYPLLIYTGTVYHGEHYAIDEGLGIMYAVLVFCGVHWLFTRYYLPKRLQTYWKQLANKRQTHP